MSDRSEGAAVDTGALAAGLWGRLRDVLLVAGRIESFSFREGEQGRDAIAEGEAEEIATDFVLRALRAASDRTAWTILAHAADAEEGVPIDDLAAALSLPRLAVAERVSDLLQLGLVARALDVDRAHATPAGVELVRAVRAIAGDLAARVRAARLTGGGAGDGLPVL